MKKILVIGSYGSGKSTFAKRLHNVLNIELIHLDEMFWSSNWEPTPEEVMINKIKQVIMKESWIIDGFYPGTFDIRFKHADTIIFLDLNRLLCLYNAISRTLKSKLKIHNPDKINHNPDFLFDFMFYYRIWTFKNKIKPLIIEKIVKASDTKNIIILNRYSHYNLFLKSLNKESNGTRTK